MWAMNLFNKRDCSIFCTKFPACSMIAVAAGLAMSAQARAQDVNLDPVKIVSDKLPEEMRPDSPRNPYRVEKTGQFGVEIFTQEDIQNLAPKDVFDLLTKAAGIDVTYQGRKSPFFVNERGGGNVTFIIDDAILPTTSNRILQNIPLGAIEEIQIVRGSTALAIGPSIPIGSSASGSGISSAFVIIRTKRPSETQAIVSTFAEQSPSEPVANGQSAYLAKTFGKPKGDHAYVALSLSRMARPSNDQTFDAENGRSIMGSGGFSLGKLSANGMVYVDSGKFDMQRGVTVTGALDPSEWYYDPIKTSVISADATYAWTAHQTTIVQFFDTKYNQHEIDASFANATVTTRDFRERNGGFSLRHNEQFGGTLVQLDHQVTSDEGFGPNLSNNYNNWKTRVSGWSASVEQSLWKNAVTIDAGFRRDQKHIDYSATRATALSADSNTDLAPAIIYTGGARWRISPKFALNARYFHSNEGTTSNFGLTALAGVTLLPEKQDWVEGGHRSQSAAATPTHRMIS